MLGILGKSLQKLFGTKYERDIRTYLPLVEEINRIGESLSSVTNDELRHKTMEFKQRISEFLREIDEEMDHLHAAAAETDDLDQKEDYFSQIDQLVKERNKQLEIVLKEILPEAFAVVRETARRFKENETLTVKATEHDRNLAAHPQNPTSKSRRSGDLEKLLDSRRRPDCMEYGALRRAAHWRDGPSRRKIAEMATGEGKRW